ncbi:collectin-10 isoform X1 [Acyrthosiphon pisum]|uniref:C-type lectin domain-containing protein n=1 Tax=Acyrthosiphon pisum TaxID=7029 RepID=A0A8R1W867_ACYPI|nr:collectin-10 isoform X1 [Acyrthosiphon pisum]|eukprot:XP_001950803.2 PREDICTED: collectin-10 isoform X1 [Acyrthosiphon pisum]
MYYSGLYRANMNSWTDTAARSIILFLTLFMCFVATRSQIAVPRTAHKLNEPQGGDLVRQNSITQQILAQYLQKRLNRAGGSVQQIGQPQLLLPTGGNDLTASVVGINNNSIQKNVAENLYDGSPDDDDDIIGDARYYQGECNNNNCVEDSASVINKWSLPLLRSGDKKLYLGIFFKANWYKAAQYCRYHGMHLASISNQEENDKLEKYIKDNGLGHEHFWTSGTDQAEEGSFFWLANGRPIGYTNWNAGEPNNFKYENGEEEHCLELWNRDGKGLKWNDSPCSFETFFVCEM